MSHMSPHAIPPSSSSPLKTAELHPPKYYGATDDALNSADDAPQLPFRWRTYLHTMLLAYCLSALLTVILYYITSAAANDAFVPFLDKNQYKLWAQYSPFYPVEPYHPPPRFCSVTQVNLIQRHGARFPTSSSSARIKASVEKLKSAEALIDPRIAFVANYTYDLGANDLVPFGAAQSIQAGQTHFKRYGHLFDNDVLPFVRSSSGERVVLSALNWTLGVAIASKYTYKPTVSVILSENLNDTLDDNMCPNAGGSDEQTGEWLDIYGPPVAARLNAWAPGANLTGDDVFNLISLCPFDSVAHERFSPFCPLFTEDDFEGFAYSGDLDKYYGTGYGQPLGPVQGVGYINELIARLTGKPVQDNTQTNRTLDSSPKTFPLNRTFYADFSHDNQMIAIYSAMGLFPQAPAPDPTDPSSHRTWRVGRMVPFSAQMITEKVQCSDKEYVRVLVGDAVQPLKFCGAGPNGMCELDKFVASQSYSRNNGDGDFEKCFS